jgi:hypothetical protein
MQNYMRDQLVALAARPTKQEAVAANEGIPDRQRGEEPAPASIVDVLSADRH